MNKTIRGRAIKFLSPLLITAIILSSLVVFPSSTSALTASMALDGTGSLGDNRYLLGEWITYSRFYNIYLPGYIISSIAFVFCLTSLLIFSRLLSSQTFP